MPRYLVELRGKSSPGRCPQCYRSVVFLTTRHLSLVCDVPEGSTIARLVGLHLCDAVNPEPAPCLTEFDLRFAAGCELLAGLASDQDARRAANDNAGSDLNTDLGVPPWDQGLGGGYGLFEDPK